MPMPVTNYVISPIWAVTQFFDNDGDPLSGGKIFTYQASSTSVQQTTYSDNAGTPNANPIVLDSSGRSDAIWIDDAASYNFVLTQADGTTVLMDMDNIGA